MDHLSRRPGRLGIPLAILTISLCACAPSQTNQDFRMVALQGDVYRVAKSNKATREAVKDLSNRFGTLKTKIEDLESRIEELTVTSEKVQTAGDDTQVSGRYDVLEARMEGVEKALRALTNQDSSHQWGEGVQNTEAVKFQSERRQNPGADEKDQGPQDHLAQLEYEKAYAAYREHRYAQALGLFEDFLNRYPEHELADNAQYWLGETYYDMGDYGRAILTFKDVVTRYSAHAKAPDALLKIGYSYIALDDPSNARMFLKRVTKNYPSSAAEAKARAKLQELDSTSQ